MSRPATAPPRLEPSVEASPVAGRLQRLTERLALDRAVTLTLVNRGWAIGAAPLTLFLTTSCLTQVEQGFYYTFNAVLGSVVFLELGLSIVLSQFAAHEMARLTWHPPAPPTGDPVALRRLASLMQLGVKWYLLAGVIAVAALVPLGLWFFADRPSSELVAWRLPWVLMTVCMAAHLILSPICGVFEGAGFVTQFASLRLSQAIAGTLLFWLGLVAGVELFAMPMMAGGGLAVLAGGLLWKWRPSVIGLLTTPTGSDKIRYVAEVLPLHFRLGMSWLSGYMSFFLCTPILFAAIGPEIAGRYGLTASLCLTASSTAQAWVTTRGPEMGRLIAAGEFTRLHQLFRSAAKRSSLAFILAATIAFSAVGLLNALQLRVAERLLSPLHMAILLSAVGLGHGIAIIGVYLRAYKQDVLCYQALASGLALLAGTYFIVPRFGVSAALTLQVGLNALCLIGAISWYRFKSRFTRPLLGIGAEQ